MKNKILLTFIMSFLFSSVASAMPVLLERNYTNYAWGYQNYGCMVDEAGFVYQYDLRSGEPMKSIGQATEQQIESAIDMLKRARVGVFALKRKAFDAGATLWSGQFYGQTVKIKQTGDYEGLNTAAETLALVNLIDQLCEQ